MARKLIILAAVAAIEAIFSSTCSATPLLFGDTINGEVRRVTDPVATNYFSPSSAVVSNSIEFLNSDGEYNIEADFDAGNQLFLSVQQLPATPDGVSPNYHFVFTGLDFSPPGFLTGLTELGGTPGVHIFDVVVGPSSAEFSMGSDFLSNGGSLGLSVQLNIVPEPSSLVLAALGLAGLAAWGWRWKR